MKMYFSKGQVWGFLLTVAVAAVLAYPALANDNPADHPLRILKARYQNDSTRGAAASAKGNLTIWMQNSVGVAVDGIEIEVELYNDRKRKVETLRRDIGLLEAGEKKIITFRWDVIAEDSVKPRFFVEYNRRGNQKARFEGDSPNWQ